MLRYIELRLNSLTSTASPLIAFYKYCHDKWRFQDLSVKESLGFVDKLKE